MSKNDFAGAVKAKLATVTVGNVTDMGKLGALIKSIGTRAANLDIDIHAAGIAALRTMYEHGDTSAIAKLTNALGKHTRAKAFADWAERYSDAMMTLKAGNWKAKLVPQDYRRTRDELIDLAIRAMADPFWTVPEKSATDFSLHDALRALLKKAENASKKGTLSEDDKVALVELTAMAEKVKPADLPAPKVDANGDLVF